jgi:short-subunit dehydrogenase
MYIKEYPVKELTIDKLKDNLYEIKFLIKNAGYGKLKLDFAFYSIENKDFSNSDDFFACTSMKMGEYFGNL